VCSAGTLKMTFPQAPGADVPIGALRDAATRREHAARVLCLVPARISTPIQGVFDVAVAWFVLRRGRVIWSVSVAIRGRVIERA
jgi:ABC-type sulfate transport system permease subunit